MSTEHLRCALRVAAPFALLILAACNERAQTASTYQEFADTKHPGVSGAIDPSTGNPEIDAVIGAADVIKQMERSDKLEAEAIAARDSGDVKTAESKLDAAMVINRSPNDLEITSLGVALQLGETKATADRFKAIKDRLYQDRINVKNGYQNQWQMIEANLAIKESERVLQALAQNKMKLGLNELHLRQYYAANTAVEFYRHRSILNQIRGDTGKAAEDEAKQHAYEQMQADLSGALGTYNGRPGGN